MVEDTGMSALDHAIASMTQEVACYSRDCDAINFARRQAELWGFEDVRDGVPRWQREMSLHHAELRALYAQARVEAELLRGKP
jgi:hypothetical protein